MCLSKLPSLESDLLYSLNHPSCFLIHSELYLTVSLRRSNSSMNRSASVERASDSVAPARQRNWSTAFDDLHVTLPGGGGVTRPHLPESVVVRWAAELLLAVHELHLTGLIIG